MTGAPVSPATAEAAHFWQAIQQGQLLMQQCLDCHQRQFYPRSFCGTCGSAHLRWEEASGRGEIYACTLIHRAPSPELQKRAPYLLCLVELLEGVRMISRMEAGDLTSVRVGDPVQIVMQREPDGTVLPLVQMQPAPPP